MVYRVLADSLVAFHLAFILFVVFGGVLAIQRPWMASLHLPAALWGCMVEWAGWVCPLTPLEVHFRTLAGQEGYAGGFLDHYLLPVLYPHGLTRSQQLWLGLFVVVVNLAVYSAVIRRRRERG